MVLYTPGPLVGLLPPFQTMAFGFVTPSTALSGDWKPFSGLSMVSSVKGADWQRYRDALLARGRPAGELLENQENRESSPGAGDGYLSFKVLGDSIPDYYSLFDAAAFGHLPSKEFLREVKRRSKIGTRTGLALLNYESVAVAKGPNPLLQPLDDVVTAHLLTSSQAMTNLAGCFKLDQGETAEDAGYTCGAQNTTASKGHVWLAKPNDAGFGVAWANALVAILTSRYAQGDLDFLIIDNLLDQPFLAAASNAAGVTPDAAGYQAGWRAMLAYLRSIVPWQLEVYSNRSPGVPGDFHVQPQPYSFADQAFRWSEHFYRFAHDANNGSTAELTTHMQRDFDQVPQTGRLVLGGIASGTPANYNAGIYTLPERFFAQPGGLNGTAWDALLMAANPRVYVMASRGTTGGPLYWQKGFRDPV